MRATTESGSVYEFRDNQVRRVNADNEKRADGEWVQVITMYPKTPIVGHPMTLVLEPLGRYGDDDYGNRGGATTRRTTTVIGVEP